MLRPEAHRNDLQGAVGYEETEAAGVGVPGLQCWGR
jgi:hypothetical protein